MVIDLPRDVAVNTAEFDFPEKIALRSYNPKTSGHLKQIDKLAHALAEAKRPVFYVGGGMISSDGGAELKKLANHTNTPVTETLMGLGSFPSDNKLSLGMLGMHGTYRANMAMSECDLMGGARRAIRRPGDR